MSAGPVLVPEQEKPRRSSPRKPNGLVVLDRRGVAELCGHADPDHVYALLKIPSFPRPFFEFSKRPRWMRRDVETWLRKRARAAQTREVRMERSSGGAE